MYTKFHIDRIITIYLQRKNERTRAHKYKKHTHNTRHTHIQRVIVMDMPFAFLMSLWRENTQTQLKRKEQDRSRHQLAKVRNGKIHVHTHTHALNYAYLNECEHVGKQQNCVTHSNNNKYYDIILHKGYASTRNFAALLDDVLLFQLARRFICERTRKCRNKYVISAWGQHTANERAAIWMCRMCGERERARFCAIIRITTNTQCVYLCFISCHKRCVYNSECQSESWLR